MLVKIEAGINYFNTWLGRCVAWLVVVMVAVTFFNVVIRYAFNFGLIAMQESVIYLHSFAFMLAMAYTYRRNQHVRVDIFYAKFSAGKKAWIDLLGTLFLLFPFCWYLIIISLEYAGASWQLLEGSREAGGLPLVFLLKSLLPLMPLLVFLQGIAVLCRSLLIIRHQD